MFSVRGTRGGQMIPYLTGLLSTQNPPGLGQARGFRSFPGLQVHQRAGGQPAAPLQCGTQRPEIIAAERRVQEDDVEGGRLPLEPAARVGLHDLDLRGTKRRGLLAHAGDRSLVSLHEQHRRRAPGRGLEPEGTAAGVEVQATGAFDGAGEPIEQRLPNPVGRWAEPFHIGDPQQPAAPLSRDDAYFSGRAGDRPRSLELHKRDRIARGPGGGPDTFIAEKPSYLAAR